MEQFENMTIGKLRDLTEQYERLEKENKFLKIKYPRGKEELEKKDFDLDKFLKEL